MSQTQVEDRPSPVLYRGMLRNCRAPDFFSVDDRDAEDRASRSTDLIGARPTGFRNRRLETMHNRLSDLT